MSGKKDYWFIMDSSRNNIKSIQAFTDNKDLAKAYMRFHDCNLLKLKKVGLTDDQFDLVVEENYHDRIQVMNMVIKEDRGSAGFIYVPATVNEYQLIQSMSSECMIGFIDYSNIEKALPYIKNKYIKALNRLLLSDVIQHVVHHNDVTNIQNVQMDQVKILYRILPGHFGN